MNYELAKELKDAGFKYKTITHDENKRKLPTLSELIEACGDGLHSIRRGQWKGRGNWMASRDDVDEVGNSFPVEPVGTGKTPEEAVAKLWLALNKKT